MDILDSLKLVVQINQVGCSFLLGGLLGPFSELDKLLLHLGHLLGIIVSVDMLFSICDVDP